LILLLGQTQRSVPTIARAGIGNGERACGFAQPANRA